MPAPYTWVDEECRITHKVFPSNYLRYGFEMSPMLLAAVKAAARAANTCFFVHGSYNLHAYALAPILQNTPAILQSHGSLPAWARFKLNAHQVKRYFYLPLVPIESYALPKYPHIFAINLSEKRWLENLFPSASVSFSPTGMDFELFSPGDKQESRSRLGLPTETQIVLYVGRLAPEKGIEYLLQAAARLAVDRGSVRVYLVGSGPTEPQLKRLVAELGLETSVYFVGYLSGSTLVDWYRSADVVCLPSLFEGFGMTLAEAMACGTPVVASRVGGTEDVIREFECGILVPSRDPDALAEAIQQILSGKVNTCPNIERARRLLDWSAKFRRSFDLFEAMGGTWAGSTMNRGVQ